MIKKNLKTALVFENLFSWGGAGVVSKQLVDIFPHADIYALCGSKEFANKYLNGKKVNYSFLNKFPFVKHLYMYYLPVWPTAIESLDLSNYDLVISTSHWVAKGCVTSEDAIHISYVHTPMRFLWDLKDTYSRYGLLKEPFLNYLRIWDVYSTSRIDKLITNSKFVNSRCKRYWGRSADRVIYPCVDFYRGKIVPYSKRGDYFVAGAPFAENKGGDFIINCAKELGFNLKVIGKSRGYSKLKRLARGFPNIEFLGKVNEKEKWDILKNAKGLIASGVEDFGIFPVEAISCGTPVLALSKGGYLETVIEGVNGMFYNTSSFKDFSVKLEKLLNNDWDVKLMRDSVREFSEERFVREVEEFVYKII
jgi:glycosyltransferase involved in cell wall biosynthesis